MGALASAFRKTFLSSQSTRAAMVLSTVLNVLTRLTNYGRNLVIAFVIGYSLGTDAFFMATSLVGIFVLFADVFDSLGIPSMVKEKENGAEGYNQYLKTLLTFSVALGLALSVLNLAFAPLMARLAVGMTPEGKLITRNMLMLLTPYVFFYVCFHHFGAIFRAERKYQVFYLGYLAFSVSLVILLVLMNINGRSAYTIAVSYSAAQFFSTALMAYLGRKHLSFGFRMNEKTRRLLKEFVYLSGFYGVSNLFILIDKIYASLLPPTYITALSFGTILVYAVRNLMNFENIFITTLSETEVDRDMLTDYLKFLLFTSIPVSVFFFFNSYELTKIVYGYGLVKEKDVLITAQAVKYFSFIIPLLALWATIYRAMQVLKKMGWLFVNAVISVLVSIGLNYFFVVRLKLGIAGIAAGTILAFSMPILASMLILNRIKKINLPQMFNTNYALFLPLVAAAWLVSRISLAGLYADFALKAAVFGLFFVFYFWKEHGKISVYEK